MPKLPAPAHNRMTLYWNANFKTDKEGKATAKFYNNDSTQKLHVVVEGISDGLTISTTKIIGAD